MGAKGWEDSLPSLEHGIVASPKVSHPPKSTQDPAHRVHTRCPRGLFPLQLLCSRSTGTGQPLPSLSVGFLAAEPGRAPSVPLTAKV